MATWDIWSNEGRGLVLERDREYETDDGETLTFTERVLNPAFGAELRAARKTVALEQPPGFFDPVRTDQVERSDHDPKTAPAAKPPHQKYSRHQKWVMQHFG